ncbi:MAG TPA: hypothetical protein VGS15_00520, partial [Candidatus Acidoferrales bacterium]|nr:hypothetical protein [Candidatus Acidoferrales bacterium]
HARKCKKSQLHRVSGVTPLVLGSNPCGPTNCLEAAEKGILPSFQLAREARSLQSPKKSADSSAVKNGLASE